MANESGVDEQAVAQPEDGQGDSSSPDQQSKNEDLWREERMAQISADKNRWKQKAQELEARLAQLENEARAGIPASATSEPDQVDYDSLNDADWARKVIAEPMQQAATSAVQKEIAPLKDRFASQEFWAKHPDIDPDVKSEVEEMAQTVLAQGVPQVDRRRILALVEGERALAKREAAKQLATEQQSRIQQVNQVAAAEDGNRVPKQAPQDPDDIEDPDELYEKMRQDGFDILGALKNMGAKG